MQRRSALYLLAGSFLIGCNRDDEESTGLPYPDRSESAQDHIDWVLKVFEEMQTVKAGMTREELTKVFAPGGGLFTRLQNRYSNRECPYFKVNVEFEAAGDTRKDERGRLVAEEDPRDLIVTISQPYLGYMAAD